MMINLPCTYPYNAKPLKIVLAILMFGGCAYFFANQALNNDQGVIIEHMITLDASQGTIFYWILCGLSVGLVVMGILTGLRSALIPKIMRLDVDSISLPHGFLHRFNASIPYSSINRVSESDVHGQKFLYLHTSNKRYLLNPTLLPTTQDYNEIKEFLITRAAH